MTLFTSSLFWATLTLMLLFFLLFWAITPGGLWPLIPLRKRYRPHSTIDDPIGGDAGEAERLMTILYGGQNIPGFSAQSGSFLSKV